MPRLKSMPLSRGSKTPAADRPASSAIEMAVLTLGIAGSLAVDHLVGARLGLTVGFATTVALLLRRPAFVVPGLVVTFLAGILGALWEGAGLAAPIRAGLDTIVVATVFVAARRVGLTGERIRSARMLIEVLVVTGLIAPLAGAGLSQLMAETPLGAILDLRRLADWPSGVLGAVAVVPTILLAGRADLEEHMRWTRVLQSVGAVALVVVSAWVASLSLPFPFVIVCVPLLFLASRLSPTVVAVLGAVGAFEMTMIGRFVQTARPDATEGALVLAAAATGALPIALALLLAELKGERQRLAGIGERLRQVLAGVAGHGFCSLDRNGIVTTWNEKIATVTGFDAADVTGRSFALFFTPEAREDGLPQSLLEKARKHGRVEHIGWRMRGDGHRYWAQTVIEVIADAKGQVVGFTKSVQDQSELQRSESALMAAERRIGFALGSAGQGIWELDLIEGRMHYSDIYAAMLGLSAASLGDDPHAWKDRVHPDDVDKIPPDDAGDEAGETELRLLHGDGRWIWVADRRRIAERDEADWPVRVIGTHTDITARKLAEEKFRLAVEALPNGLLITDTVGRITFVNGELERMFGYPSGGLIGRVIDELVPAAQRGGHAARRAAFLAAPTARRMGAGRDLDGQRRDGSLFPVEIGLNPISTAEGRGVLCVVTDITTRKKTEADLAMSEARHRMMADHFVDLVVHLDLELNRTWVSPAARDILGVEPESLLGRSPSGLVHPDDVAVVHETLQKVVEGADRCGYCVRYHHAAGHWIWLEVSLRLIRVADGAPVGILAVGRDVTRARAAEDALKASEATFRGAMEGASIGMALERLDGTWVSVNPALCKILGMEEADLLRLGPAAFTHPLDVGIDADQRRRLLDGEGASYQVEKRWRGRGGGVVWTHQSISLDKGPDGSPHHLILQIQDITERRQIEQMKSEFVSMVSHELRTPLTSVRGALGLVLGTMTKDMPPRAVHLVDIAHKNSERLIPLVNDILDLDKIDAGMLRVELGDVDAVQAVSQAIEATRAFCDRYGVTVRLDRPETPMGVRVDEGRFIQVITNLLSNAAKFSPRDAVVSVEMSIVDGHVRIAVRDHGPGIPDEFRAKIFGRFAQADSATTRAKGGSGLGLHICRQLVSLMGGRIDFESTVGVGSTFWVDIPLADTAARPADALPAATETAAPAAAPGRRVTLLAADGPAADFLATAVEQARLEPSTEVAPETLAVLVDTAALDTPAASALKARLDGLGPARPPVVLVETGGGETPADTAAAWAARDTWRIEPDRPARFVARIAALAAEAPEGLPSILHVEDDQDLAAVVAAGLAGLAAVTCVSRVSRALREFEARRFDLVVIDPALPDGDGLTRLVPRLEQLGMPYMVLSAEERPGAAGSALASLVKSRIGERQLVDTILTILSERKRKREIERHAG